MQHKITQPLASLVLVVSLAACTGTSSGIAMGAEPRASADPGDAALAAAAINAFGFNLLAAATKSDKNIVLSPVSVAIALGMARAGAKGATAAQMDTVLHRVASDANPGWLNALDAALAGRSGSFKDAAGQDVDVTLRIANAPFAQEGMAWEQTYLDALSSRFGAGLRLVDYAHATEAARLAINDWVDQQTEQRIPELLLPGRIDTSTVLVLVNAIYLKAAWQTAFVDDATAPAPFTRPGGSTVDVPTMHLTADLPYAAGDRWQAVELPYVGNGLAMTIIVPNDTLPLTLDGAGFAAIAAALSERRVILSLPTWGLETRVSLAGVLAAMGMPNAFDSGLADFSGMTRTAWLAITAVEHQANIDVDEHGTEAAAATGVVVGRTSAPSDQVTLTVDREFLFALRDTQTGAILFLGRVVDPTVRY
jgi:serpin B